VSEVSLQDVDHSAEPPIESPDEALVASPPPSAGAEFRAGALRILPVLLGVVPFGTVAGIAAREAGFSLAQSMGLSLFVFAGASQLAALELIAKGTPAAVVVLTALVINLRLAVYSASLANYIGHLRLRLKAPLAYLLTDQGFLLSTAHYEEQGCHQASPHFYLGASLCMWLTWQISATLGAVLGGDLPNLPDLGFAIPLTFLALLIPALRGRPAVLAAISAGGVALLGASWPAGLGLVAALVTGVSVGVLAEARTSPGAPPEEAA